MGSEMCIRDRCNEYLNAHLNYFEKLLDIYDDLQVFNKVDNHIIIFKR